MKYLNTQLLILLLTIALKRLIERLIWFRTPYFFLNVKGTLCIMLTFFMLKLSETLLWKPFIVNNFKLRILWRKSCVLSCLELINNLNNCIRVDKKTCLEHVSCQCAHDLNNKNPSSFSWHSLSKYFI